MKKNFRQVRLSVNLVNVDYYYRREGKEYALYTYGGGIYYSQGKKFPSLHKLKRYVKSLVEDPAIFDIF